MNTTVFSIPIVQFRKQSLSAYFKKTKYQLKISLGVVKEVDFSLTETDGH